MSETTRPFPQRQARVPVHIPVHLTSVTDSLEAVVVDLTEQGAQIRGASLPHGSLFQVDLDGHSVYARVMWSEVDRMGVRFPFELHEGPLFDALEEARAPRPEAMFMPRAAMPRSMGFGRRV